MRKSTGCPCRARAGLSRGQFLRGAGVAAAGLSAAMLGMSSPAHSTLLSPQSGPSPPEVAGGPNNYNVWPTSIPEKDVANVQWAMDNIQPGGTVRLKAHNKDTNLPMSFDFGVFGKVYQSGKELSIIGEPGTTISGGGGGPPDFFNSGVVVVQNGRLTLKNVIFNEPIFICVNILNSPKSVIENNKIIGKLAPGQFFTETAIAIFNIFGNEVTIRNNTIGIPGNDVARGIFLVNCYNSVLDSNMVQSHFAGVILNNGGWNKIQNNDITGCNCLYGFQNIHDAGLSVYGPANNNHFLNNNIKDAAYGIHVLQSNGDTFENNTIMQTGGRIGIYCSCIFGKVQNCKFINNKLNGTLLQTGSDQYGPYGYDVFFNSNASSNTAMFNDLDCSDIICKNLGTGNQVIDKDGDICTC